MSMPYILSMKKIMSVQDISCYGQCSLTVALPVLSAYGIETAILPSAILSTHTGGFTGFTVLDLTEEMPKIINHWKQEGIHFDAVYTGYIGDYRQFSMIKEAKTQLAVGGKLFVDPAMADHGKLYKALDASIVEGMREIVRVADVILPNLTEAAFLLNEAYQERYSEEEIRSMVRRLAAMGPGTVILTGVSYDSNRIGAVAYEKETDTYTSYFTERQAKNYHGTGDIFSSVVIANLLNGVPMYDTLADACEFIVSCIQKTVSDDEHTYGVKFEDVLAERIQKNGKNQ